MKSTILISRIMRVIETEGAVGEGASLAEAYAAAVRLVNARLEAVQTSIDAKQVSDAVRLMEDAPRLLDEVGALDFNQLPDWEVLCARHNWTPPPKLDKALLERVLMLNESTEIVEPFLRMYRKAVRTNNEKLAVQSLRGLVRVDHSQNWRVNLAQAEEAAQRRLVADFRAAKSSGNVEEAERIAQEFVETPWAEPPTSKGVDEIRAFVAEEEAKRRNAEGLEDLGILRRCADGAWNRSLAFSMLQALDGLVEQGFVLPAEDRDLVASCRQRCADEMEAEERDRRWRELCEHLHTAIQREDASAIRDALSAPEFLDREPDPDLIKQAQLVIRHDEVARRRKALQVAVCALIGLFAILGVSGWWLRQKLLDDRCAGEAVKLAALQKGSHAVDRLAEALRKLQADDPEVYADPRVNAFVGALGTMRDQMAARTNEIASTLAALRSLREAHWGGDVAAVTSRLERVGAIIAKDDDDLKAEFLALKAAWVDHCNEVDAANRADATTFHDTLVSRVKVAADRLKTELLSDGLDREVTSCKTLLNDWKRVHAPNAPSLGGDVDEAEKSLGEAENTQQNLQKAIQRLKDAAAAKDFLTARKALVEFYSDYPFVKALGEHPIAAEEAAAVTEGTSEGQKAYASLLKPGVDEAAFKTFITESVESLAEIPSYYSLYGLYVQPAVGTIRPCYFAMCKGKPRIKKPSYDTKYLIDGELLDLGKGEMVQQMSSASKPFYKSLPSSDEIKNVVDLARQSNLSLFKFEQEIVKLIAGHLKEAGSLKNKVDVHGQQRGFAVDRDPAIRKVQLLHLYLTWLRDDLNVMPRDGEISRWFDRVESFAQPVRLDGVPEDLTWTCMREDRVRQRNSDCAKLLSDMATHKFIDKYRAWRRARIELQKLTRWKVSYAGCNAYAPADPRWAKDHSVVLPSILGDVQRDHPLYLLRREKGKLILKKALVPSKSGTAWAIAPGMTKAFVPGDPLFQVSADGVCIDAEATLRGILKGLPADFVKQFADKIPLFNVEVDEHVVD